ncbi:MAG: twin-arginine translocase TatA/TatE family subunit [Spirochaetia bacterium]|nr:twin-arginine translocase TatA/TatE family subunit [Spirochaetia bacterium]
MVGMSEILVIGAVVLVIFGGAAIPKFAKSLGKAKSEFEKGVKEGQEELKKEEGKEKKDEGEKK